ncbi:unnamed protein product [Rotaria sp. Silwood2]|nr:unnamed protein product [Rotaria sp. Silwood2]CAF3307766.1 unnamed protein product [Rotaria sp. Silwood2]CAF4094569.1 unnamed protein product [Rotaria sp. Silwood2]CAF4108681.1 unnamed protein product [Rotaria sp. Silwood2]
MYLNSASSEQNALPSLGTQKKLTWKELVKQQADNGKLKGATCAVYSKNVDDIVDKETQCICGRLPRQHSFTGKPKPKFRNAQKWTSKLAAIVDVTQYGQLENGARFIRCDTENDTFETLGQIIVKDVGAKPKLLVSCYGGAEYFTMTDDLEREFMNGIGQVAATKDVWILTTGLNSGVSNLISQGVHRNKLLNENIWKPIVIGMSHWGTISEYTRQVLKQQASANGSTASQDTVVSLDENDTKALDKYHTHFLLLDDGRFNHYLNDDPRSKFVKTTCDQAHCHAVTIIVEGGLNTLEVIQHDLNDQRPVVIVHGSGRLASVLGNLLNKAGKTATIE